MTRTATLCLLLGAFVACTEAPTPVAPEPVPHDPQTVAPTQARLSRAWGNYITDFTV